MSTRAGDRGRESSGSTSLEVAITEYGVPHVQAETLYDLGRGAGYISAQQHLAVMIDRVLTLRGRRSETYGPDERVGSGPSPDVTNLDSDLFWRYLDQQSIIEH